MDEKLLQWIEKIKAGQSTKDVQHWFLHELLETPVDIETLSPMNQIFFAALSYRLDKPHFERIAQRMRATDARRLGDGGRKR